MTEWPNKQVLDPENAEIKPLQIEESHFILDQEDKVVACDDDLSEKLGLERIHILNYPLKEVLLKINPAWSNALPSRFREADYPFYLHWEYIDDSYALGIKVSRIIHGEHLFLTLTPDLYPGEDMQGASIKDIQLPQELVAKLILRLQLSESRLNMYLHNFPGYFFCQRPDLSFTYLAPKLADTLDCTLEPFYKNGSAFIQKIYSHDQHYFLKELEKHSRSAKTFSISYRIRSGQHNSGDVLYFMDVRTPIYSPNGLLMGYDGVWLDISRQSIAENRLTSSSWKENLATITSGLVHDFSNIMAGIHSLSELYYERLDLDDPMFEGMGQIKKNSLEAQKLVRRIIDLNKEESGQRDYHNIISLIKDQMDIIRILMPKHTSVETHFTEEELPVFLDEVSFRQMILNLSINARDAFDPEKPGTLSIFVNKCSRGETVFENTTTGSYQTERDSLEIMLSDNGCGIDHQHLHKIFAPFFTTKESTKGSGFGLYNAKLFIENNRGRISVESEKGKGTTFHILLPLADFTEMETEAQDESSDPLFSYNKKRPNLVVYGQEDPCAFELIGLMRQQEWEVITFDNEQKVKQYLSETQTLPHMLFLFDIGHDDDAYDLAHEVRHEYPGIKIGMQMLGRNPDAMHDKNLQHIDLCVTESNSNGQILKNLKTLVT